MQESDTRKLVDGDAQAPSGEKAEGEATVKEHLPELDLIRQAESEAEKSPPPDGSPLAAGSRLGRYEIRALLGAGGMGRVYRAHDPTLNREVAIKALAHAFQNDSGSMRRFEREARVLAALSHPNIAAIYGFEELDGAHYLVLEKVEGETLSQRLGRGPLPLKEALAIAVQVAEGLAEAHGKGVVHRDLKPSNVMLASGGRVKLVDFGLAKSTGGRYRSISSNLTTAVGTVVGTAPYMSPEQIQGDDVDPRTDVWAFGCLLFEMLTGRQAFRGRSVAEVLAAVLRDEPDLAELPATLPREVRRVVERCLRKDLASRLQHIGDARLDLVELSAELAIPPPPSGRVASRRSSALPPWAAPGAAAVALAALVATIVLVASGRRAASPRLVSLSLELPRELTLARELSAPFALAPAGSPIAVAAAEGGVEKLFLRGLDDPSVRAITGTEKGYQPFFSPDGRSLGFFADRKLKRVPLDGGPPLPLCDIGVNPRGATWPRDGTIVVSPSQTSGLVRVPDGGGAPTPLTTLDLARGESSHRWPESLPGGRWVLFTVGFEGSDFDEARLDAVSLETLERRPVLAGASFGRYAPGGNLVFVRGGRIFAVRFDLETLKTRGTPEVVLTGVRYDPQNGAAHVAVSPSGALLYSPGVPTSPETYVSWLAADGTLTRVTETPRMFRDPRLSPDGTRIAVVVGAATDSDLWTVDAGGTLSQVTFGLSPHRPTFTPDGRRLTVGAEKDGRWRLLTIAEDGKGDPQLLLSGKERVYPNGWSPDGRTLLFQRSSPETGWDLLLLDVDEAGRPAGAPRPLAASPFNEANAEISADGRWVAYESDELDALVQVHVRSFPDGGSKRRASTGGARWPSWDRAGNLFYRDTSVHGLQSARTHADGTQLAIDEPRPVYPAAGATTPALAKVVISVTGARFNVHPSGDRFLVLESSAQTVEPPLSRPVFVLDWGRHLESRVRP